MRHFLQRISTREPRGLRDTALVAGPVLIAVIAGFSIAFGFVEPAPPKRIEIASGGRDGAYFAFAGRYREILKRHGIELAVRETSGSVENLRLLADENSGVDIALVQGGISNGTRTGQLVSLASLYREALWVFVRRGLRPVRLTDLDGKRLAIGAEGSGSRVMARRVLSDNGLIGKVRLLPLGGSQAATALRTRRVDAAFFIASPHAGYIRDLLADPEIEVMSFRRAGAYLRRHRYLSRATLPEGMFDLTRNVPPREIVLLAPTAGLIARNDLHPALIELLMGAVTEVHGPGGVLEAAGEFPSGRYLDLPLNSDAARYLESGPGFLQRYLPFWVANFLDRTKVMLVPLITLLIPLLRILPPAYRWRMRSKIIRNYKRLGRIERDLTLTTEPDFAAITRELEAIEDDVLSMNVSSGYLDAMYALRLHIGYVRSRIERLGAPG